MKFSSVGDTDELSIGLVDRGEGGVSWDKHHLKGGRIQEWEEGREKVVGGGYDQSI